MMPAVDACMCHSPACTQYQLLEDSLQLLIGYGSGDQQARLKLMRLADALALFDGV
jgi:hypothetical protein